MRLRPVILAMLTLAPASAVGEDPFARGMDPLGSKLGTSLGSFLTVEGARTAPARSFQLSLAADYGAGLLSLREGDEKVGNLLERRLDLHLLGSFAITDWAELGVDLPLTVYQAHGFDELRERTGLDEAAPESLGAGDARLLAKVRLLQADALTVGVIGEARLPTGDEESFLGERGVMFAPRLVVERSFGDSVNVGLEGGYRMRSSAGQYLNLYAGDELTVGVAGSWRLPEELPWTTWTAYGEVLGATPARSPFHSGDAMNSPLEALLGVKAELGGGFFAMVGGGTGVGLESGFGREGLRAFAQIRYERIFHDRDGDGVEDSEDQCIDVPEDDDGFEDGDGCPDPDNDKDGVLDVQDRCPDVPGLKEYDGCPDTDGDEIPDGEDACPEEKGPAKNEGCPAEDPQAVYGGGKIDLKGAVNFDTAKDSIKRDSFHVLDQVAKVLSEHPELKKVRVEGHTDSQGSDRLNRDLSQRRAAAVVQYLIRKGIDPARFDSQGYGEEQPVAPNTTALGRAKNRRVEFTILEKD